MIDAPPNSTDPFEPMRRSYEEALDTWSQTVEQMLGTDRFASASNQMLAQYAEMQRAVRDTSRATADALHVPTKDDVARVAELVVNVERKVDEVAGREHVLAELVERLPVDGLAAIPGRLLSLETKLDALASAMPPPAADHGDALAAIAARLTALEGALEALRATAPPAPADPAEALRPINARLSSIESTIDGLAAKAADAPARGQKAAAPADAPAPAAPPSLPVPEATRAAASPARRPRTSKGG